jgi:hypothetical protein
MSAAPAPSRGKVTYRTAVRSFDHGELARFPAYARVRRALSDLASEAGSDGSGCTMTLAGFLEAVRDMTATASYGDNCSECMDACTMAHPRQGDGSKLCGYCGYQPNFAHRVERQGDGLVGHYRCPAGHAWTCGWAVSAAYRGF